MQADWWTLALQATNALVLIWLLQRFLFRPVADIIKARQAEADSLLSDADTARNAAVAEREKASAEAARQAETRTEALKAAEAEADARKKALVAAARAEAERLVAAAADEIERTREAEATAGAERAARLAVDIAAKLFHRLPHEAQIDGFIAGLAEGLAQFPEDARAGFAADGAPIQLRTPRPLTQHEITDCRATIGKALGRPVEISVEVDPEIIAGLEAEGAFGSVRNSFRADLEHITEALTHHVQQPT